MNTVVKFGAALLASVLLIGCGDDLPTCSDAATQKIIGQIFFNSVAARGNPQGLEPGWAEKIRRVAKANLSMIRTTGTNEQYGKRSCEAQLQVLLPDGSEEASIKYTIQLTDDKKDQLVQMTGHQEMAVFVAGHAWKPEFKRATANMSISQATPAVSPAPALAPTPGVLPKPQQPQPVVSTQPSTAARTVADVTVIWLDCEDLCHLQYKTAQGELKSALCTEAPFCRQWAENPSEFNKRIGSHATLKLGSQFVPEGGVTLDSVQELEWKSLPSTRPIRENTR